MILGNVNHGSALPQQAVRFHEMGGRPEGVAFDLLM